MKPNTILRLIMLGLLAWGVFHAVGAYLLNYNPWRPVVVLACSGGFLGFWLLMLSSRQRRLARAEAHETASAPSPSAVASDQLPETG